MPVYHSEFNDKSGADACNAKVFALRTKEKGPAPPTQDQDIIDEAISFFRANVLFKKFETKGPGDLITCYLTAYIAEVLRHLRTSAKDKTMAQKKLTEITLKANFPIPGEKNFAFSGFFKAPASRKEGETIRAYLMQLRKETGTRLLDVIYNADGTQNKWWFQFSKREFMGIKKVS